MPLNIPEAKDAQYEPGTPLARASSVMMLLEQLQRTPQPGLDPELVDQLVNKLKPAVERNDTTVVGMISSIAYNLAENLRSSNPVLLAQHLANEFLAGPKPTNQ